VRQIGGPKDRWVPEMVFGTDFSHKFDDRQSIVHVCWPVLHVLQPAGQLLASPVIGASAFFGASTPPPGRTQNPSTHVRPLLHSEVCVHA